MKLAKVTVISILASTVAFSAIASAAVETGAKESLPQSMPMMGKMCNKLGMMQEHMKKNGKSHIQYRIAAESIGRVAEATAVITARDAVLLNIWSQ